MRRVLGCLLVLFASMTLVSATMAQTPATLPDPSEFGEGWTATGEVDGSDLLGTYAVGTGDSFAQITGQAYWGPAGASVTVLTIMLPEDTVAVRQGWEDAKTLQMIVSANVDHDFALMMDTAPLVGCDEVSRMGGTELGTMQPVGSTLCAPNDQTILLVQVNGTVNELTGVDASDALVTEMIGGQ